MSSGSIKTITAPVVPAYILPSFFQQRQASDNSLAYNSIYGRYLSVFFPVNIQIFKLLTLLCLHNHTITYVTAHSSTVQIPNGTTHTITNFVARIARYIDNSAPRTSTISFVLPFLLCSFYCLYRKINVRHSGTRMSPVIPCARAK
jgi:hypothetical protein